MKIISLKEAKEKYKFCKLGLDVFEIKDLKNSDFNSDNNIEILEEKPLFINKETVFKKMYLHVPGMLKQNRAANFDTPEIIAKFNEFIDEIEKSGLKMYNHTKIYISNEVFKEPTDKELEQSYIRALSMFLILSKQKENISIILYKNYAYITFMYDDNTSDLRLVYSRLTVENKKTKAYNYNNEYFRVLSKRIIPTKFNKKDSSLLAEKIIKNHQKPSLIPYVLSFESYSLKIELSNVPTEYGDDADLTLEYNIFNYDDRKNNESEINKFFADLELLQMGEYPEYEEENSCEINLVQL